MPIPQNRQTYSKRQDVILYKLMAQTRLHCKKLFADSMQDSFSFKKWWYPLRWPPRMHLKKLQQTEIHLQLCSNTEITLLLESSCKLIWRFISYIIRMGSGRKIKSLLQTFLCMLCYFCRGFWGKKTASARLYRRPAAVIKTLNCSCLRFQTNDCSAI